MMYKQYVKLNIQKVEVLSFPKILHNTKLIKHNFKA